MSPAAKVPTSDEGGSSYRDYAEQIRLWTRMTHLDPAKRAAAFILRTNSAVRRVCLSAGSEHLDSHDGALRTFLIVTRQWTRVQGGGAVPSLSRGVPID